MRLSKLSKARLAAMAISASKNIAYIKSMKSIVDAKRIIDEQSEFEKRGDVGIYIWNELSTMGMTQHAKTKIARCFELVGNLKVIPQTKLEPIKIGTSIFSRRYSYSAIVPTSNNNGHNYPLYEVCILGRTGSLSACLRRDGVTGNSIDYKNIAFPTEECLFRFFDTGSHLCLGIADIRRHYDKDDLDRATNDRDWCINTIALYKKIVNDLVKINMNSESKIIPIID